MGINKKIEIKNEKYIKTLIVVLLLHQGLLYLVDVADKFFYKEPWPWPYNLAITVVSIIMASPVLIAYFKCSLNKEQVNLKNWKQYIIGIVLYFPVLLVSKIDYSFLMPADFSDYSRYTGDVVWLFFYYFFVVALLEEFIYRVYVQGELSVMLGKAKWLAPLFSAVLFGFAHIVNGNLYQVALTTIMGLVLGYAKFFVKDCTFISVVIAHGLYDYILACPLFY